ncbi:hypothetical protein ACWD6P_04575 [Streptomyces sp. NPDC002446]
MSMLRLDVRQAKAAPVIETFSQPGVQLFIVPADVHELTVEVIGAGGGGGGGGVASAKQGVRR